MITEMTEMLDFSVAILSAICDFLATPPVFYVFSLICFVLVCKAVKIIMR